MKCQCAVIDNKKFFITSINKTVEITKFGQYALLGFYIFSAI